MEFILEPILLFVVGAVAGVINTLAGGGSMLTLPALIFLGLPPTLANATSRIGVIFNAFLAWQGYRSKGLTFGKYELWLGFTALLGAILGTMIAVDIDGETFNRILALVIVMIIAYMVFGRSKKEGSGENVSKKSKAIGLIVFFFIGIYGGFIQAGVGYLIISALSFIHHFGIVRINMIKSITVLIYSLSAISIFIWYDLVNWPLGLALAAGNGAGGWFTSRWSVGIDEKWIRYFVMLTAIGFAVKLVIG